MLTRKKMNRNKTKNLTNLLTYIDIIHVDNQDKKKVRNWIKVNKIKKLGNS